MADTSYLREILTWAADNKEWVFSGYGLAVIGCVAFIGIVVFCGWLYYKNKNSGQTAKAGDGAIVIQSGRDSNIGDINAHRK